MLLVPLIVTLWTAGLLLVAGLCAAARRGDAASALAQSLEQATPEPLVTAIPAALLRAGRTARARRRVALHKIITTRGLLASTI